MQPPALRKSQKRTGSYSSDWNQNQREQCWRWIGLYLSSKFTRFELENLFLIDSKSSIDIFNNAELLTEIHSYKKYLKLHCNAGYIHVMQKGWFGGIEVWYHPKGIVNILSLKTLKKRHHVSYNSKDRDWVFRVHSSQGVVEFFSHESGIHYLNLKKNKEYGLALLTTIRENFEGFIKKQVEGAIKAHCFQAMLRHIYVLTWLQIFLWPQKISLMLINFLVKVWQDWEVEQFKKARACSDGLCLGTKQCYPNE